MSSPRTRIGKPTHSERYPLGEFPLEVVREIGRLIIYRHAVGANDITGDEFGEIFARAVGGKHAGVPEGLADVTLGKCGWSVKTVKHDNPFNATKVRLISGRNSPGYSYELDDVKKDVNDTGNKVLGIWNERVQQARYEYPNLRIVVLLRGTPKNEYAIFECEAERFNVADFEWCLNKKNNLEGFDAATKMKCFTFQPHGSQFTIHRTVPASVTRFSLVKPISVDEGVILRSVGFEDSWVELK